MSGFVGIFRTDGSSADPALLQAMTEFLSVRGPDAQAAWFEGPAGLGHALFRTTREAAGEHQPLSLDGNTRIASDARLDAREELCIELSARLDLRPSLTPNRPDAELILRAFEAWGERCVEHLLGDFSFVIWDAKAGRVFCARDHFGHRPLFYARTAHALLVSNTLEVLRLDPKISDRLNDNAIADFLISGSVLGPETTVFEDIARVPAAHVLVGRPEHFNVRRYWTLPIEEPLRRRETDIAEEFRALLLRAARDRLRTDRVSFSMSGGLDSTSVAGACCEVVGKQAARDAFLGITYVFERAMPDSEGHYAKIAADHFGFPIKTLAVDGENFWESLLAERIPTAEPTGSLGDVLDRKWHEATGEYGRVQLTGHGGDIILKPSLDGYRGKRLPQFAWDLGGYVLRYRRLPQIGFGMTWQRWRGKRRPRPKFPTWLNPELVARLDLRKRWEQWHREKPRLHPFRPDAHASLTSVILGRDLESYDTGTRAKPIETRHPLFDLRLVQFCLRLPAVPWCSRKRLLRIAMRDILPREVLRRPKTPLASASTPLLADDGGQVHSFHAAPELEAYVAGERASSMAWTEGMYASDLRPIFLNLWLQTYRTYRYKVR